MLDLCKLGEIEGGGLWSRALRSGIPGVHRWRIVSDRSLREFFLSDFIGDVSTREGSDVDAEGGADRFGKEGDS